MLDLSSEAMEALLRIHQPHVIEMWNKDPSKDITIQTFWDIKLVCRDIAGLLLFDSLMCPNKV